MHSSHTAETSEVIAQEVHDHDIFAAVLDIVVQLTCKPHILCSGPATLHRTFHGSDGYNISLLSEKQLRGKSQDGCIVVLDETAIGYALVAPQIAVKIGY